MKNFISAAALALTLAPVVVAAPAQAGPITTLGECYTAVINWCTETFPDHADECGHSSGLDDCDEEFGNSASSMGLTVHRPGPDISRRAFQRLMAGAASLPVTRVSR